ncbi:MAG: imelysin family protein [Psychrobacter sp.]|nr:imelysin family protein [Psychrobacter sp.]
MKKYQAIAMALSALSAGLLISCAKPNNDTANQNATSKEARPQQANPQETGNEANHEEVSTQSQDAAANNSKATEVSSISAEAQSAYLTHVAKDIVIPAYHDAVKQSEMLNTLAKKHCATGAVQGEPLLELRGQWIKLAQAWAAAEMINFGPATQSMSNLYINYYPDERGLVHNGVAELIASNPNLTPEQLAQQSAVVQGVPGLEEALFAQDSLKTPQCNYVISASSALNTRLMAIEKQWQDTSVALLAIDKTAESDQGLNQWVNSLLSFIETMKSTAIDQPLGLTGNKKGHLPADSAGQSRAIINAKLATLNKVLTDPVLTAMLQANPDGNAVGDKLLTALSQAATLLAQMPNDIGQADKATQQKLLNHLTSITQIIKRELIPALGVRVGFNSTDGD